MRTLSDEALTVIVAIITFFTLSSVIVLFVIAFQRRQIRFKQTTAQLQLDFETTLIQSQLEMQEQTRLHIAEELHDNIGALSSLIKINLNLLSVAPDEERRTQVLKESKELVKTLITDVKQLSISLHTNRLTSISITEAFEFEIQRIQKLQLFTINFQVEGEEVALPNDKQIILYRICQELLHNIVKHAQPTLVTVRLLFTKNQLQVFIDDDGVGFDVEAAKQKVNGSGLINLYNRAKLMGGSLYLKSDSVNGTHCTIQIPLPPFEE